MYRYRVSGALSTLDTAVRSDGVPLVRPSHPVSIDAVRSGYERERRPKKGPDKSLEIDLTYDPASLQSTAGLSQLIPLDVIQERESASAFSAWMPEMIESVIQKLDDLTIMGRQLKIEHDNRIDT